MASGNWTNVATEIAAAANSNLHVVQTIIEAMSPSLTALSNMTSLRSADFVKLENCLTFSPPKKSSVLRSLKLQIIFSNSNGIYDLRKTCKFIETGK